MQSVTRIGVASLAMLLLGTSATLAQPYGHDGYGRRHGQDYRRCYEAPYGPRDCAQLRQTPAFEQYREANQAEIVNYIVDPATDRPVTSQKYRAEYPWSDQGTWQYNAETNLWVDLTYRKCYDAPYGPRDCAQLRQTPAFEKYRQANGANIVNYIVDPATGQPVTEQNYQAEYPRSDPGTWQYNAVTNLWVDPTPQQSYQTQNDERFTDRDRERDVDRDRDRDGDFNRDRDRDRDLDRDRDRDRNSDDR